MTEVPELWWSESAAEARGNAAGGVLARGHDGRPEHALPPYESELLDAWPADVVPFVPADARVTCPRCRLPRWTVDGVMAHHEVWVGQACPGVGMKPERPVELEARVDPAAERAAEPLLAEQVARISVWCRAIAQKARAQGNEALAATAPRIAEEIDRALAGCPLEYARDPDPDAVALVTWLREQGHDDPPPFAPELADAPLVTGESGAPAPLVVDQPVHESTLPAELEEGRG